MKKKANDQFTLFDRRKFIKFFGLSSALLATGLDILYSGGIKAQEWVAAMTKDLGWTPVDLPLPSLTDGLTPDEQIDFYSKYEAQDDLILPEGFTYNVIASWGDPVGDCRYGYNNDHVGFVESGENQAYLVVNHESMDYDNLPTYLETFPSVMGYALPDHALKEIKDNVILNFAKMDDEDPKKEMIKSMALEGAADMGISVISVERSNNGDWVRTFSEKDRRISVTQALKDPAKLSKSTGPASSVFRKQNKIGFDDGLLDKCIGSFWNCSGGTTPWGTVISAEEWLDAHVIYPVKADGSSFPPTTMPFYTSTFNGLGNIFELAGNKYGWGVEVDPENKDDFGTKHTMLGRYRHEAFAFNCKEKQPLAIYAGDDTKGGHIYKMISAGKVSDPKSKSNSKLLEEGVLHAAKFSKDGTGYWIPLTSDTILDPVLPSSVIAGIVSLPNPDRLKGGTKTYTKDDEVRSIYKEKGFNKLGDLYFGDDDTEIQGAILIDAHHAANAIGATGCPRPEDCEFDDKKGVLYFACTAITGDADDSDSPDREIFAWDDHEKNENSGDHQNDPYRPGMIIKIADDNEGSPESLTFRWETLMMGGEPTDGGAGWANPDNLELDDKGNLWMVTDIASEVLNQPVIDRDKVSNSSLRGIYSNNSAWFIPTSGPYSGQSFPFAIGPAETELCGLQFSKDQRTLFLTPQHPGIFNGRRKDMAFEERKFALKTTDGKEFFQVRKVPIGSNWPSKEPNQPPRSSIVGVRRKNNKPIV